MLIQEIRLSNYRNIEEIHISGFSETKNIIIGQNAQGKTNLIEAINYLSCAKSFRTASEDQLIKDDKDEALLGCVYKRRDHSGKIEAKISRGSKKAIKVNGMPISRVGELLGKVNTVVFAPEDMRTLKESPGFRRKMLDMEISKIKPSYYKTLQRLNEILKNKNMVLKQKFPDKTLIEVYNEELAEASQTIIMHRMEYIEKLSAYSAVYHSTLKGNEKLELIYRPCVNIENTQNIRDAVFNRLCEIFESEAEMGYSLTGPQREDFDIIINGKKAKLFSSQGQQRTAMISIKLAVSQIAYESTGEYPVLLLDDVFSELDAKRADALFDAIQNMQVFITAADGMQRDVFKKEKVFVIENGRIEE